MFIGHASLLLLAARAILRLADQEPEKRPFYWALLAAVVFGPISFWMWDEPVYGWHPELLIAPLSVLFCCALLARRRTAWLWASLLVPTHESAPLVAGGIHLLVHLSERDRFPRREEARVPRWLAIGLGWATLFVGGLVLLALVRRVTGNTLQAGRMNVAITALMHSMSNPMSRAAVIRMTIDAAKLMGACLLLLTVGAAVYRPVALLACALPLWGIGLISSMAYLPDGVDAVVSQGLTWPSRFVLLWSILAVGLILSIHMSPVGVHSPPVRRAVRVVLATAACILTQVLLLGVVRGYRVSSTLARLGSNSSMPSARLSRAEDRFLRCLSDRLPANSPVAVHGSLFARFHRHEIVWPNHVERAAAAPIIVVCDARQRFAFESGCGQLLESLSPREFQLFRFQGLEASARARYTQVVSECGGAAQRLRELPTR